MFLCWDFLSFSSLGRCFIDISYNNWIKALSSYFIIWVIISWSHHFSLLLRMCQIFGFLMSGTFVPYPGNCSYYNGKVLDSVILLLIVLKFCLANSLLYWIQFQTLFLGWTHKYHLGYFVLNWAVWNFFHLSGLGYSQRFWQIIYIESPSLVLSFPGFPAHCAAGMVALHSLFWFFSAERLLIFCQNINPQSMALSTAYTQTKKYEMAVMLDHLFFHLLVLLHILLALFT